MSLVSVIIPTYNHEIYLPGAIHSALAQTYRDVEIIVVDDGSTDETRDVATQFGEPVQYIYQENRGLSAARNTGIARATGRYITVLDADDLLEPDYLARMVAILESLPGAAATYCIFQTVDPDNQMLYQKGRAGVPPEQLFERLLYGNFIVPPCMMVKREVYDTAGPFDESLTACEDWDMWLRIARNNTVLPLDAALVRYRVRPGSMSGNPRRMLDNRLTVLGKQKALVSEDQCAQAIAYAYRATALEWLQNYEEAEALSCLNYAAKHYPPLFLELETWYELALWDQPKGMRGDLARVDSVRSEKRLLRILEKLNDEQLVDASTPGFMSAMQASAYRALGLISYTRREMHLARRYFHLSLKHEPSQLLDVDMALTVAKSLLPAHVLPALY